VRRAAATRLAEAEARANRTNRALDQAKAERAAIGPEIDPAAADARQRFENAQAALAAARAALEEAEAERVKAAEQEAQARQLARNGEDQLGRLRTEARGLAQLTAPRSKSGHAPALDSVAPDKGYGAALAAALGDDLDAALDARAPSYWGGAEAPAPAWPEGAEPLAPLVKAPPALAARLSHVAVVARDRRRPPAGGAEARACAWSPRKATCGAGTASWPAPTRPGPPPCGWSSARAWPRSRPRST
jgi:chromosome segregation protein